MSPVQPLKPNRSLPDNPFADLAEPDRPKDVRWNIEFDPAQNQAMKRRERRSNPRNATRNQSRRRKTRTTALNPAPMSDAFPASRYNVSPPRQTDFLWGIPKCEFTFSIEGDSRGKPMQHGQGPRPAPIPMATLIKPPVKNAVVKLPQSPDHYVKKESDPSTATKGKPLELANKQPRLFSFPASQTTHHTMGRSSLFPSPPVVASPTMCTTLRPAPVVISSSAENAAVAAACRVIANRRHTVPAVCQRQPVPIQIPKPVSQTKERPQRLEILSHTQKMPPQETSSITLPTHSMGRSVSSTVSNLSFSSTSGESSPAVTFSKACEPCQKPTFPCQMQPWTCNSGTCIQISPSSTTTSLYTAPASQPTVRMSPMWEVPSSWRLSQDPSHTVPMLNPPVPCSHRKHASQEELEQFLAMGHAKDCWCSNRCGVVTETARANGDAYNLKPDLSPQFPPATLDDSKFQQLVVPHRVDSPSLESVTLTPSPLGSEFSDLGLLDDCGTNIHEEWLRNECDEDLEWIMVALNGPAFSEVRYGKGGYAAVRGPSDEQHRPAHETFTSASEIREQGECMVSSSPDSSSVEETIPQQDQPQLQPSNPKRVPAIVTTFPSRGSTGAPVAVKLVPNTTDKNGANTSGAEWPSLQDGATIQGTREGATSSTGDGRLNGTTPEPKSGTGGAGGDRLSKKTRYDSAIEDHGPADGGGVLLGKKAVRVLGGGWTGPGL